MSDISKSDVRLWAKEQRSRAHALSSPQEVAELSARFVHTISALKDGAALAGYCAKGDELYVSPLMAKLSSRGISCALPVVQNGARELLFAKWREGDPLEKGAYGISQPADISPDALCDPDIIMVPLLAFDLRGYRLGMGGGYYDATLKALRGRKQICAVGIAYCAQACLSGLPVEEHDEKLDWVITPNQAYKFGE